MTYELSVETPALPRTLSALLLVTSKHTTASDPAKNLPSSIFANYGSCSLQLDAFLSNHYAPHHFVGDDPAAGGANSRFPSHPTFLGQTNEQLGQLPQNDWEQPQEPAYQYVGAVPTIGVRTDFCVHVTRALIAISITQELLERKLLLPLVQLLLLLLLPWSP